MHQKTVILANFESILVEWAEDLSYLSIKKDGVLVGTISDKDALKQGRSFTLSDGQKITVVYTEFGLEVWQNGEELVSGGKSKSVEDFGNAVSWLMWVGGIQLAFAPISYFTNSGDLERLANIGGLVIAGGVLLVLGLWAKMSGSKTPFWIGIVLCAINILLTLIGGRFGGILISGFMLYRLYKGTQSEPPKPERKSFVDPNAPLDSEF